MKIFKWQLVTTLLLALMLDNLVLAEGDGDGDSDGDVDGSDHHDDDDHHHHSDHSHHNFILGIGGYYDPWLWGGYYNPGFWGGSYYNPGFLGVGPYGYRSFGYRDPFFRPYYAYPPTVVAPTRPSIYIQQQEPKTPRPKTSYWHYSKAPEGYYPYIKECPGGWLQVVPQPSAQ
ncbi:MAG: hypothetical protein H0X02_00275 [Nitrosomonas sp.]|nr:hypothetical protein [Nitrosomonas sp.]